MMARHKPSHSEIYFAHILTINVDLHKNAIYNIASKHVDLETIQQT